MEITEVLFLNCQEITVLRSNTESVYAEDYLSVVMVKNFNRPKVYLGLGDSKEKGKPAWKNYCKISDNNVNYWVPSCPDFIVVLSDHC